ELPAGPGEVGVAVARAGPRRAAAALAAPRPPHEVPAAAAAGRDGVPGRARCPGAVSGLPRTAVRVSLLRPGGRGPLPAGRVGLRVVRRQLELAGPDLVPGQL